MPKFVLISICKSHFLWILNIVLLFAILHVNMLQSIIENPLLQNKERTSLLPNHDWTYCQIMIQPKTKLWLKQSTKRWRKVLISYSCRHSFTIFWCSVEPTILTRNMHKHSFYKNMAKRYISFCNKKKNNVFQMLWVRHILITLLIVFTKNVYFVSIYINIALSKIRRKCLFHF